MQQKVNQFAENYKEHLHCGWLVIFSLIGSIVNGNYYVGFPLLLIWFAVGVFVLRHLVKCLKQSKEFKPKWILLWYSLVVILLLQISNLTEMLWNV